MQSLLPQGIPRAPARPGRLSRQIDRSIAVTEATFTTAIKPMAAPASGKGGLSRNQSGSVGWCENLLMRRDIGVPSRLATSRHPSTLHWLCLRVCVLEHSLRLSAKLKRRFGFGHQWENTSTETPFVFTSSLAKVAYRAQRSVPPAPKHGAGRE